MTTEAPAPAPRPGGVSSLFFWERPHRDGRPSGADLAALRRGAGREAGSVPQMWNLYEKISQAGTEGDALRAEHAALVLFAIHQQSQTRLMHQVGIGLGKAIQELRASGKFSEAAVDRRFGAAATATSLNEASYHLRGLVRQLRSLPRPQPLDYTRLYWDLLLWQDPMRISEIRRQWGIEYFIGRDKRSEGSAATPL